VGVLRAPRSQEIGIVKELTRPGVCIPLKNPGLTVSALAAVESVRAGVNARIIPETEAATASQRRCMLSEGTNRMSATSDVQKRKLELKARRKPLFAWYEKNPNDTNLVLEIKIVDDQIAECNQQIERERIKRN
jgi:hypothetical protein